jgi:hypothetical protein
MVTMIGAPEIVTDVMDVRVGSVVEVAVIVTVPPVGMANGAVKLVTAPLAVCAGAKVPHKLDVALVTGVVLVTGVQVASQSKPKFLGSFATVAESEIAAPGARPDCDPLGNETEPTTG